MSISPISGFLSSISSWDSDMNLLHDFPRYTFSPLSPSLSGRSYNQRKRFQFPSVSMGWRENWMESPYVCGGQRDLMMELVSRVETGVGWALQPCSLPSNVQQFGNPDGTAHASLHLRSGLPSSQIDLVLGAWIHCKLPTGGALNITSLSAYVKPVIDAPHFLLDIIQSSPTSVVLVLDLSPRKDLIMHPDYLKAYYEDTQLEQFRQRLYNLPEVTPYVSPSFYIRALLSPTAILASINVGGTETTRMDCIIREQVGPIAKELLQLWMEACACLGRNVGEVERVYLAERDRVIKVKMLEELGSSFPRMFGQNVAETALCVLKEYYNK